MRRFRLLGLLIVSLLFAGSDAASAGKRVALVIGNGAYKEAPPLINTGHDATDMAEALKRLDFDVLDGIDLDKRAMERLIRRFDQSLSGAEIALFFYAGHGMQVSGQNYLVPTDARLAAEGDIDFESLPLSLVLTRMEREAKTSLVLLDACRDNPLARNLARTMGTRATNVGQGLAEVKTGVGTLIGFSTQPGNVALDGRGRNSPYTTALLKQIETPGRDVLTTLAAVRGEVVRTTGGKQVPWEHTSLMGPVVLKAAPAPVAAPQAPPAPPPPAQSAAAEAWPAVKDTTSIAALEAFIRRHGDTFYGDLARVRIEELKQQRKVAVAAQPPRASPSPPAAKVAPAVAERAPVHECDRLAADASDPERVPDRGAVSSRDVDYELSVPACEQAVRTHPNVGRFHYQLGRSYEAAKRGRDALGAYEKAASHGHALAMHRIGYIYKYSSFVDIAKNETEAANWFLSAATAGSSLAMYELGQVYAEGRGKERNDALAKLWYERAAASGNLYAMYKLGIIHRDGLGVTQNDAEAVRWILRSLKGAPRIWFEDDLRTKGDKFGPGFWMAFQEALLKEGVYKGKIDGTYNDSVRLAIKRYVGR